MKILGNFLKYVQFVILYCEYFCDVNILKKYMFYFNLKKFKKVFFSIFQDEKEYFYVVIDIDCL